LLNKLLFLVIDDEATKVYTAGAIVTVTIVLVRQNMKILFGDDSIKEKTVNDTEEAEEKKEEKEQKVQKPVWQKQNKKQKSSKKKKVIFGLS